jgi:hypothetical protein
MMQIVEGGCIDPSGGTRLRAKLTRQGVALLAARGQPPTTVTPAASRRASSGGPRLLALAITLSRSTGCQPRHRSLVGRS